MKRNIYISILAVLSLTLIFCSCNKTSEICGMWKNESDGIYLQLRSDDSGTLAILGGKEGRAELDFQYEMSDGRLIFDFTEESVENAEYSYTINKDKLTLNSGNSELEFDRYENK